MSVYCIVLYSIVSKMYLKIHTNMMVNVDAIDHKHTLTHTLPPHTRTHTGLPRALAEPGAICAGDLR